MTNPRHFMHTSPWPGHDWRNEGDAQRCALCQLLVFETPPGLTYFRFTLPIQTEADLECEPNKPSGTS